MVAVSQHALGDLIADAHDGVEGGHRLLENHSDARAAELAHRFVGKRGEIAGRAIVGEKDFAGDLGLRREQAHDGEGCDRFAGAGFADQPKDFAGGDGKIEIADGGQGSCGGSRAGLSGGEIYVQVADFEKRSHRVMVTAKRLLPGDGLPRAAAQG